MWQLVLDMTNPVCWSVKWTCDIYFPTLGTKRDCTQDGLRNTFEQTQGVMKTVLYGETEGPNDREKLTIECSGIVCITSRYHRGSENIVEKGTTRTGGEGVDRILPEGMTWLLYPWTQSCCEYLHIIYQRLVQQHPVKERERAFGVPPSCYLQIMVDGGQTFSSVV